MLSLLVCLAVLGGLTVFFLLALGVGLARFSQPPVGSPAAVDGTTHRRDASHTACLGVVYITSAKAMPDVRLSIGSFFAVSSP